MNAVGITLRLRRQVRSQHVGMHLVSHLHPRCAQRMVGKQQRRLQGPPYQQPPAPRGSALFSRFGSRPVACSRHPASRLLAGVSGHLVGGAAASQVRPPPRPQPTPSRSASRGQSQTLGICEERVQMPGWQALRMSCAGRRVGEMAGVAEGCCRHARRSRNHHVGSGSACPGRGFRRALCQQVQAGHAGDAGPSQRPCPHDCHATRHRFACLLFTVHLVASAVSLFSKPVWSQRLWVLRGGRASQMPQGDPSQLDAAEMASVRLFQQNTPSVVNISNIRAPLRPPQTFWRKLSIHTASVTVEPRTDWARRGGAGAEGALRGHGHCQDARGRGQRLHLGRPGAHREDLVLAVSAPATPTSFIFLTSAQVTNNHVIQGADDVQVSLIDQSVYNAKVGTELRDPRQTSMLFAPVSLPWRARRADDGAQRGSGCRWWGATQVTAPGTLLLQPLISWQSWVKSVLSFTYECSPSADRPSVVLVEIFHFCRAS